MSFDVTTATNEELRAAYLVSVAVRDLQQKEIQTFERELEFYKSRLKWFERQVFGEEV